MRNAELRVWRSRRAYTSFVQGLWLNARHQKKSKYNYVGWVLFYSLLQPENLWLGPENLKPTLPMGHRLN